MRKLGTRNNKTWERQKQIMESTLQCFTELGYNETGMTDICEKANASMGSIYHHFKSKEQLAASVYIEGIRDYQEGFIEALEKNENAREGIFAVIGYHLNWVREHPDWSRFLFQMRHSEFMGEKEDEFNVLNENFFIRTSKWFIKHVKEGAMRRFPKDVYVPILLGPCQEYTRQYINGNTSTELETVIKELSIAAWRTMRAGTE